MNSLIKSIKAIKELNLRLQESIDNFKKYHIEKGIDIHEVKYGQENDDRIVFLQGTRLHYMDFFANTDKVNQKKRETKK